MAKDKEKEKKEKKGEVKEEAKEAQKKAAKKDSKAESGLKEALLADSKDTRETRDFGAYEDVDKEVYREVKNFIRDGKMRFDKVQEVLDKAQEQGADIKEALELIITYNVQDLGANKYLPKGAKEVQGRFESVLERAEQDEANIQNATDYGIILAVKQSNWNMGYLDENYKRMVEFAESHDLDYEAAFTEGTVQFLKEDIAQEKNGLGIIMWHLQDMNEGWNVLREKGVDLTKQPAIQEQLGKLALLLIQNEGLYFDDMEELVQGDLEGIVDKEKMSKLVVDKLTSSQEKWDDRRKNPKEFTYGRARRKGVDTGKDHLRTGVRLTKIADKYGLDVPEDVKNGWGGETLYDALLDAA